MEKAGSVIVNSFDCFASGDLGIPPNECGNLPCIKEIPDGVVLKTLLTL